MLSAFLVGVGTVFTFLGLTELDARPGSTLGYAATVAGGTIALIGAVAIGVEIALRRVRRDV